jgi:hypothetical protein
VTFGAATSVLLTVPVVIYLQWHYKKGRAEDVKTEAVLTYKLTAMENVFAVRHYKKGVVQSVRRRIVETPAKACR